MSLIVKIPDGDDWTITMYHCDVWLNEMWPGIKSPKIGCKDWDFAIDFQMGYMTYEFKDPQKAMLFKLRWGGK